MYGSLNIVHKKKPNIATSPHVTGIVHFDGVVVAIVNINHLTYCSDIILVEEMRITADVKSNVDLLQHKF